MKYLLSRAAAAAVGHEIRNKTACTRTFISQSLLGTGNSHAFHAIPIQIMRETHLVNDDGRRHMWK